VSARFCVRTGKVCYSRRDAGLAARAFAERKRDSQKLYPYKCRHCLDFHVGRTDPVAMRRRQERDERRRKAG
jgi:hypothetical protein